MRDTNAAKDLLYRWLRGIDQPFLPFMTLGTNIRNEVLKKIDDFADDWDAWPTTRRPTRISTWPELVTKMLPWLRISKYYKANRGGGMYQKSKKRSIFTMFFIRQQEVCSMFESLSKTAQAELEMQKGRRVTHFQKSLQELAELEVCIALKKLHVWYIELSRFQVKHAKAHAQMLRQTISAIKTEVWELRLKNGPYNASNELEYKLWFVKNTICQLSRLFAIWLLMFPGNSLDLFVFVSIFNCDQKSDDLSYQVWKHVKWTHDIADFVYLLELNLIPRWNCFFKRGDY